jgi:hypothetical protein
MKLQSGSKALGPPRMVLIAVCLSLSLSLLASRVSSTPVGLPPATVSCKLNVRPLSPDPPSDTGKGVTKNFTSELGKRLQAHGCKVIIVDPLYVGIITGSEDVFAKHEDIRYGISGSLTFLPQNLVRMVVQLSDHYPGGRSFPSIEVGPVPNDTAAIEWFAHEIAEKIYCFVDPKYRLPKQLIYAYCFRDSTLQGRRGKHLHSDTLPAKLRTALEVHLGQEYEVETVSEEIFSAECLDPHRHDPHAATFYRYAYVIHGRFAEDYDKRQISLYIQVLCPRSNITIYRDITISFDDENALVDETAKRIHASWPDILLRTSSGGRP